MLYLAADWRANHSRSFMAKPWPIVAISTNPPDGPTAAKRGPLKQSSNLTPHSGKRGQLDWKLWWMFKVETRVPGIPSTDTAIWVFIHHFPISGIRISDIGKYGISYGIFSDIGNSISGYQEIIPDIGKWIPFFDIKKWFPDIRKWFPDLSGNPAVASNYPI